MERILGGPPRDESTGALVAVLSPEEQETRPFGWSEEDYAEAVFIVQAAKHIMGDDVQCRAMFRSDVALIWVMLDEKLCAVRTYFTPVRRRYDGPWATLRSWLKL